MQDVRIVVDSYGRGLRGPPPSAEMNPIVYTDTLTITIVGVKRKIVKKMQTLFITMRRQISMLLRYFKAIAAARRGG